MYAFVAASSDNDVREISSRVISVSSEIGAQK
jgi:hypothetical protein